MKNSKFTLERNQKQMPSEEEILQYKDFDAVLASASLPNKRKRFGNSKIMLGVGAAVLLTLGIWLGMNWNTSLQKNEPESINKQEKVASEIDLEQNAPTSQIDADSEHKNPIPVQKNNNNSVPPITEQKQEAEALVNIPKNTPNQVNTGQDSAVLKIESQRIFVEPAYQNAEPKNGYDQLTKYFDQFLRYPVEAQKDSVNGTVVVGFVISAEGKVENVKVIESLGVLFDAEAMKVIQNMPEWLPAKLNGKPVESKLSIPLSFSITSN